MPRPTRAAARRPLRRPLVLAAGPVLGAFVGVLTNVITETWNWWLLGVLTLGVFGMAAVVVATERGASPPVPVPAPPEGLSAADVEDAHGGRARPTSTPPHQLPPVADAFTGREADLAAVAAAMRQTTDGAPHVVVSTLSGKGGVGKTALAVRAARDAAPEFPDGQLYIDLRGVEPDPLQPADVLAGFLRALGVEQHAIPDSVSERQALYRSRLAHRRVLVVLDNAASEAQVRPLLPGSETCAVIVTSRRPLAALPASLQLSLDVLTPDEAVEMLARIVGAERLAAEPEAGRDLVRLCGYLPLAVRVAGGRLLARRHWLVQDLVRVLSDEHRRLRELRVGDLEVQATFRVSYDGLPDEQQRVFRLLGLLKVANLPGWAAAAALDTTTDHAEDLLEELCDAQLVEIAGRTMGGDVRYRFHDLLRDFARDRALDTDPVQIQREALQRVYGGYLAVAERADNLLEPGLRNLDPGDAIRWTGGEEHFTDSVIKGDPQGWFIVERPNLVVGVQQAFDTKLYGLTWELAGIFAAFFAVRIYPADWEATHVRGLEAAAAAADPRGEAFIRRSLGRLYRYQGRWEDALACYEQALSAFEALNERLWQGVVFRNLGDLDRDLNQPAAAIANFERSIAIFRDLRDQQWEAASLIGLGETYLVVGDLDKAIACYEQCLPIFEAGRHRWWRAVTLVALGTVHHRRQRLDEALRLLDQGQQIFVELGDERRTSLTNLDRGTVYRDQGRYAEAVEVLEQSLDMFRRVGDKLWEARTMEALASVRAAATPSADTPAAS